jgi:hypothetical protein
MADEIDVEKTYEVPPEQWRHMEAFREGRTEGDADDPPVEESPAPRRDAGTGPSLDG